VRREVQLTNYLSRSPPTEDLTEAQQWYDRLEQLQAPHRLRLAVRRTERDVVDSSSRLHPARSIAGQDVDRRTLCATGHDEP
jgi:hypothetical protein